MRVDREFVFAAVAEQRRQIATLIEGLNDTQLATTSLCAGWDVKTVAAHLISVFADGFWVFIGTAMRRGGMARAIDELARRGARRPTAEIVAALRHYADHPLSPPLVGPRSPLADILIHGGDIRIPLKLPFEPEPALTALALDFLTGPWPFAFVPSGRLRGISLRATDVNRSWGRGAEVRGPAAALMMTITGRAPLIDLLDGPGLPTLKGRL